MVAGMSFALRYCLFPACTVFLFARQPGIWRKFAFSQAPVPNEAPI
jgi:hypothetical protein